MKRSISAFALLFTSVSAILGSGWLFANYYTSMLAGPAATISWIIGGATMIFIAFIFAELCTLIPITGSSTRIPHYTHGTLVSFMFSWIIWLAYASLAPTEVQAVIQYLSYFFPIIIHESGALTSSGYVVATLLMLAASALNIFSLRWLLRLNNVLTVLKIAIPLIIGAVILFKFFTPEKAIHPVHSVFMPYGWHGVLAAIATGGIVFAFNGFKQACELAGEAKNPYRTLPLAIIGSIAICLAVYMLLQFAFYSSLTPANLVNGWHNLILSGHNSPIASILSQDELNYLLPLLYIGAIAGPLASALMYISSASRSLFGMSKNKHIPHLFQKLTGQGNPVFAICVNFILGMMMFAPLPGWDKMISFLTSLMAITYSIGPVCLLALRYQLPNQKRPFKLPFATTWTTVAFYICTLLTYWSGWETLSKLAICLGVGLAVLFLHRLFIQTTESPPLNWRSSIWIWPYFVGISIISYLGNFGGHGIIPFGWDFLIIGLFCMGIMFLAIKFKLPDDVTKDYVDRLELHKTISVKHGGTRDEQA